MMSASRSNATTNYFLNGDTHYKPGFTLAYNDSDARFQLGKDCNLYLYDVDDVLVWRADTFWPTCFLYFSATGRIFIKTGSEEPYYILWYNTVDETEVGKYIAVLHPEGKFSTYGPSVWSVGAGQESINNSNSRNEMVSSMTNLNIHPLTYNMLFSGQKLHDNSKLVDGEYSIILTECELVLQNSSGGVLWRTETKDKGKNCSAILNNNGVLAILDDANAIVWSNELAENAPTGEYVLAIQQDGNAVIYGPKLWSPTDAFLGKSPTNVESDHIEMINA